jgi:DNA-binding beta-propeller fold protein YncE
MGIGETAMIGVGRGAGWTVRSLGVCMALALSVLCSAPARCAQTIPTGPVSHLFDITGLPGDALSMPSDVAVASDGRIYVVDGGNDRLAVFAEDGKGLFAIGRQGGGAGELHAPVGLGLGPQGRVFVADTGNRRIQVFDPDGRFLYGFPVTSGGRAVRPVDVAVDPAGERVYVTGNDSHDVMVFSPRGEPLQTWGGEGLNEGEFRFPATVAIGPSGWVYVVDVLNTRVQVFSPNGELLVQVGSWGVRPGQLFRPKGVAVDGAGRVYVGDSYLEAIQVFDDESRFVHVLGHDGTVQRFVSPAGLAVDGRHRLYVAEMWGNKVSVHRVGGP